MANISLHYFEKEVLKNNIKRLENYASEEEMDKISSDDLELN